MAPYIIIITTLVVLLLMPLFQSTASTNNNIPLQDQDLGAAIQEMQKANYFAFVMLINMFPLDTKTHGNVTFFMPNDRMLSKTVIPQSAVSAFLHRHSIPSPLLFEQLQYIPTGSVLPSSEPEYMLRVTNGGGRRSFFLNNVRIISPNICSSARSSIRCHGIDGVLNALNLGSNHTAGSASPMASPPSPVAISPFPADDDDGDEFAVRAPQPADSSQHISGSSSQFLWDSKLVKFAGIVLIVSIFGESI